MSCGRVLWRSYSCNVVRFPKCGAPKIIDVLSSSRSGPECHKRLPSSGLPAEQGLPDGQIPRHNWSLRGSDASRLSLWWWGPQGMVAPWGCSSQHWRWPERSTGEVILQTKCFMCFLSSCRNYSNSFRYNSIFRCTWYLCVYLYTRTKVMATFKGKGTIEHVSLQPIVYPPNLRWRSTPPTPDPLGHLSRKTAMDFCVSWHVPMKNCSFSQSCGRGLKCVGPKLQVSWNRSLMDGTFPWNHPFWGYPHDYGHLDVGMIYLSETKFHPSSDAQVFYQISRAHKSFFLDRQFAWFSLIRSLTGGRGWQLGPVLFPLNHLGVLLLTWGRIQGPVKQVFGSLVLTSNNHLDPYVSVTVSQGMSRGMVMICHDHQPMSILGCLGWMTTIHHSKFLISQDICSLYIPSPVHSKHPKNMVPMECGNSREKNHGFVKGVFSIQGMGCFDHQNPKKLDQSPLEDLEGKPDGSGHSTSSQTSGASCLSQRTPGGGRSGDSRKCSMDPAGMWALKTFGISWQKSRPCSSKMMCSYPKSWQKIQKKKLCLVMIWKPTFSHETLSRVPSFKLVYPWTISPIQQA